MSFDEFEQKIISLENFNETLNNFNNDIYLKDFEVGNNYEAFERQDEIINYVKNVEFTPCVVIDFVEGKIQRCGEKTKLRQLRNLFGTWQIDREAIKEVDSILLRLGVCDSHFQFDNKYLHKSQNKQLKDFNQGVGCTIHSWKLNNKNIQVPYIGQYSCKALQALPPILTKTFEILFTFCEITSNCDTTSATNTTTNEEKISLNEPPSLLMIKILFKEISRKKEKENVNDYEKLGRKFGQNL
ncbi:hypothetical protein GLOIN_2v1473966 [Rhizophagus clarus]|nr:hypothetical protein GLOIN_2v1473966 [Rhizophagus clarus]